MKPADLQMRGVHAYYETAHVLFGVDLTVPAGSTMALVGRNGAGKTTLMRSVCNVLVGTTGSVLYGDTELHRMPPYRVARLGVQLVPEDRRIFGSLTVRQNLELALSAVGRRSRHGVSELIDAFPILEQLLDRQGYALSGGEQQLVAIARAMAASPSLLLLDEPSEGLAPLIVAQVGDAIRRIQRDFSVTVLLAEQNTRFALGLADNVCLIDSGTIVWTGPAPEFAQRDDLHQRYLAV